MPTVEQLKLVTQKFFDKHWDAKSNICPPKWSNAWRFFHSVPFNEHRGCYVQVKKGVVVYVGVALNSGAKGYRDHSLGTRIRNYWRIDKFRKKVDGKSFYQPSPSLQKREIDSIYTLGFPLGEQEYLAAALEHYLIQTLRPSDNINYNK